MYPFDPSWDFETLVDELSAQHHPGSLMSGKTRNALIYAWGMCVGRTHALGGLLASVKKHGSRAATAAALWMRRETLRDIERLFKSLPERAALPQDASELRTLLDTLSTQGRADLLLIAADLVQDPEALRRLASSPALRSAMPTLGPVIRLADLQVAVQELEQQLDGGVVKENAYQSWCDRHSWAFGNAYVMRDDVRRIDAKNTTDMLLPNLVGFRDIVELKRPDARVLGYDRSHKTYFFSSDCSRAIAQSHKYMDALHAAAQQGFKQKPHLLAYHPRAIIVIGRSADWNLTKSRSLRGLNERLHGVTVMTYDHLLGQARQLLKTVGIEK